jgi:hypothetical protein
MSVGRMVAQLYMQITLTHTHTPTLSLSVSHAHMVSHSHICLGGQMLAVQVRVDVFVLSYYSFYYSLLTVSCMVVWEIGVRDAVALRRLRLFCDPHPHHQPQALDPRPPDLRYPAPAQGVLLCLIMLSVGITLCPCQRATNPTR